MNPHQMPEPDPELPKDACPNGCAGFTASIEWKDGKEHHEDTRCIRCGMLWKQGESPNQRS